MENEQKLYKVTLKGMTSSITGIAEGISYVVAINSHEAYKKVKDRLDAKDYGFAKDRELHTIELIATICEYNNTGTLLYL